MLCTMYVIVFPKKWIPTPAVTKPHEVKNDSRNHHKNVYFAQHKKRERTHAQSPG